MGCSTESDNSFEKENHFEADYTQNKIKDGAISVYKGLLDSLYPKGYVVSNDILIQDSIHGVLMDNYVNEITYNSDIIGYLVENYDEKAYYISKNNHIYTIYDNYENSVTSYDLEYNAVYNEQGRTLPLEPVGSNKFWGNSTHTYWLECGVCMCQWSVTIYYIFWIPVDSTNPDMINTAC